MKLMEKRKESCARMLSIYAHCAALPQQKNSNKLVQMKQSKPAVGISGPQHDLVRPWCIDRYQCGGCILSVVLSFSKSSTFFCNSWILTFESSFTTQSSCCSDLTWAFKDSITDCIVSCTGGFGCNAGVNVEPVQLWNLRVQWHYVPSPLLISLAVLLIGRVYLLLSAVPPTAIGICFRLLYM